uniref:Auxin-responsive protein n=1 Tax=Aegilops tauschii subsp. strangulata TaxID=200361 RepID=A0A452Y5T3_AEGTS
MRFYLAVPCACRANFTFSSKKLRPAAAAPVVGWPPVRSFRRNLASSSSKPPAAEPHHGAGGKADCSIYKGRFVKINMDGVPIGRKVDLKAHGSYGKLADAVDHLFQGLLAGTRAPARRGRSTRRSRGCWTAAASTLWCTRTTRATRCWSGTCHGTCSSPPRRGCACCGARI